MRGLELDSHILRIISFTPAQVRISDVANCRDPRRDIRISHQWCFRGHSMLAGSAFDGFWSGPSSKVVCTRAFLNNMCAGGAGIHV